MSRDSAEEIDRSSTAGRYLYPQDIREHMIRIESKLDTALQIQAIRDAANSKDHDDHENRLRKMETKHYVEPKTVWMAVGIFTAFGSLVVAIINLATR